MVLSFWWDQVKDAKLFIFYSTAILIFLCTFMDQSGQSCELSKRDLGAKFTKITTRAGKTAINKEKIDQITLRESD